MNKYNGKNSIPKNIRQIGHISTNDKIYIEDYVMTYFKQLYREPFEEYKLLVLIGENKNIEDVEYMFINGVIEVESGISQFRQILENENINKITRIKDDFFEDKDIVGAGVILKNEWLGFDNDLQEYLMSGLVGDVVIVYDENEEEMVYTFKNKSFIRQKGYYVYYDRNEDMQNYMLCMKDGKSIEYGYSTTEIVDKSIDDKIRTFTIPKNTVYTSKNIDFDKYKDLFTNPISKKIKYGLVSICIIALLLVSVLKIDRFESITKKKAKDLYGKTKEVINKNEDSVLEIEVIEEDATIKPTKKVNKEEKKNSVTKDNGDEKNKQKEKEYEEKEEVTEITTTIIDNSEKNIIKENSSSENVDASKKIKKSNQNTNQNTNQNAVRKNYYIVKKGDVLVDISKQVYGNIKKVEAIKKINGIKDEDKIFIGQRLLMP